MRNEGTVKKHRGAAAAAAAAPAEAAPLVLEGIHAVVDELWTREEEQDERAGEHDFKHADALAACTRCGHAAAAAAVNIFGSFRDCSIAADGSISPIPT